jgi:hypothetical protein
MYLERRQYKGPKHSIVPGVKLVTSPLYHAESWPMRGAGGSSSDYRTCLDLGVAPVRQWRATTGVLNEAKTKVY